MQHLPLADQIIILGEDGRIAEQGSWDDLRAKAGYISKLVLDDRHESPKDAANDNGSESKSLSAEAKKTISDMPDSTRKTGDIRLYSMEKDIQLNLTKKSLTVP